MQIFSSKSFEKDFSKLPKKTQSEFSKKLTLLLRDSRHPSLRLHKLHGKYSGTWSISITGDIRAIIDMSVQGTLIFMAIGSHSELYS
jgi:addiction module RelE/StbE family toxin